MTTAQRMARHAYAGYQKFKMSDPLVNGRDGEFPATFEELAPTEQLAWESAMEALLPMLVKGHEL